MRELFKDADVIYSYTRAQAIDDGVLVAFPEMQKLFGEAGITIPVALTTSVWNLVEPGGKAKERGECWTGRLWDVIAVMQATSKREAKTDRVRFSVIFTGVNGRKKHHGL